MPPNSMPAAPAACSALKRTEKAAVRKVDIAKPASYHTRRHSFATHLPVLVSGYAGLYSCDLEQRGSRNPVLLGRLAGRRVWGGLCGNGRQAT